MRRSSGTTATRSKKGIEPAAFVGLAALALALAAVGAKLFERRDLTG